MRDMRDMRDIRVNYRKEFKKTSLANDFMSLMYFLSTFRRG